MKVCEKCGDPNPGKSKRCCDSCIRPTQKCCTKCKRTKPKTDFFNRTLPSGRTGLKSWCKSCGYSHHASWCKKLESKKLISCRRKAVYAANPEPAITRVKKYARQNPDKIKSAALLRRYGVSLQAREEMFAKQGGVCAICKQKKKLGIDHDHATGKVRALLCSPCNTALGLLQDSARLVYAAAEYLAQHGNL